MKIGGQGTAGVAVAVVVLAAGAGWALLAQARAESVQGMVSRAQVLAALEPAEEQTIPVVSYEAWSPPGTYWCLQETSSPPLPFDPFPELPCYLIGNDTYLIDDRSVDYEGLRQAAQQSRALAMQSLIERGEGSGEGDATMLLEMESPTNQLMLEIVDCADGVAHLSLRCATNQVYAIWSATNLAADWQVEREVWPTDTNAMPFTVPTLDRENLFFQAEDWTGKDSDSDGLPDWWGWLYFGATNVCATCQDCPNDQFMRLI